MKSPLAALFLASIASVAYGNTPLTSAYLGTDYLTMTGWDASYIGCGGLGCGGEFGGAIAANGGAGPTINTNFWCVDAQEDFSWGNNGYADVVELPNITADAADVSYSNVGTGGANPTWTYTTGTALSGILSAQARYEMAAWLIQQYEGFADSIQNVQTNDDIQEAIWDLTSNSTSGVDAPDYAPTPTQDPAAWVWVQDAVNCYTTPAGCSGWAPSSWAVVSWSTSSGGILPGPPNHQTFLVQLTPEPGFFGVLGLGMAGLLFGTWRRKKKNQNHSAVV